MRWHDLLFAHWPIRSALLRPLLPPALDIDTFEGQAWIAVVPFRMTGIRLRGCPALPGTAAFPEINVRTYVRCRGYAGVWFFSLDAASCAAVASARAWYRLAYHPARMTVTRHQDAVHFASVRRGAAPRTAAWGGWYRPIGAACQAAPGTLIHWLTERYCMYSVDRRGNLLRTHIHHAPWPLQPAEVALHTSKMLEGLGLQTPEDAPLVHFSRRLDTRVWWPKRLPRRRPGRA